MLRQVRGWRAEPIKKPQLRIRPEISLVHNTLVITSYNSRLRQAHNCEAREKCVRLEVKVRHGYRIEFEIEATLCQPFMSASHS